MVVDTDHHDGAGPGVLISPNLIETKPEKTETERTTEQRELEPYSAFSRGQRSYIVAIVTATGFFGPLSGGIYLPALSTFQEAFSVSASVINGTVSVFMVVFAVAVRSQI